MKYQILQGDNRQTLKTLADNSIDAIVTDPPYGIDFLGKAWDANTGALETYQECLRVLKPGGHILAFSAARTYHHLAITLEQAGFEIRDQIMWIYSSGFPKSQDVGKSIERSEKKRANAKAGGKTFAGSKHSTCGTCGKTNVLIGSMFSCDNEVCDMRERLKPADNEWNGWGTSLKPAHEPICLARKPIKFSIAKNVQIHGTGALNIDACRIAIEGEDTRSGGSNGLSRLTFGEGITSNEDSHIGYEANAQGRFPSNVIGEISEPYQKYFYCPKVSRRERHTGFELPPPMFGNVQGAYDPETGERFAVGFDARAEGKTKKKKHDPLGHIPTNPEGIWDVDGTGVQYNAQKNKQNGNNHPTVKPVELMKYLIKLVTPPGGIVLDPFNGSGSTGMAAVELGHEYIGCELDPNYVEIAKKRIEAWNKQDTSFEELFE